MIIDNPDAFKTWLTSILEPLCDADPAALAKYVYALVKKEKPVEDLREGMLDQLDVFLQQETKPFVDMLFKSLETQEYLQMAGESQPPVVETNETPQEPQEQPEQAPNGVAAPEESPIVDAIAVKTPIQPVAPRHRVVVSRSTGPVKLATTAPVPAPALIPRAPPTEQTLVKVLPLDELLEEPVDQLPRRRDRRADSLRDKEDRRRRRSRSWERNRRGRRHIWGEPLPHPAHSQILDARIRYEKRRPLSRSPSPTPRGRYRNRSPPATTGEKQPSRSRSRSPIPLRERERDRIPRELERDRMSRDRDHRERVSRSRDRDRERDRSRDRSRGSAGTPTQDSNHGDSAAAPGGASLSQIFHKRRCRDFDEKGYCMRGDFCQWDHGADPVVLEDSTLSRVLTMAPAVPEYNPLAPDIWGGGPVPPGYPGFPPHHHPHHPPRELIPIPRVRDGPPSMAGSMPGAAVPPMMTTGPRHQLPMSKKNFDYNRLGPIRPTMGANSGNCSLEVKKVPRGLNDITHLNNHFGKFGRIVNIQVCFEGDPEAALITFSSHTEANVAYKSTEAVLNNRFIKVFWYNPESKQENVPPAGTAAPSTKPPAAVERHTNPPSHAGSHNKVLINKDNMKATADNKLEKAKEDTKKEAMKPADKTKQVMDMHKRAQTLLETQLQQQVLLIQRLESGNVTGPQRVALMEAINSAQEGIEKLRKELVAYNKTLQAVQANVKKPRTRAEAEKEVLDVELDLFTKQQEGQDVSDLVRRVADLRRQMAIQFPTHPISRRPHSRGARFNSSMMRYTRSTAASLTSPKVFVNQSVDHRPRALLISGFESDEIDAVVEHFSQYGELVGKEVNAAVPELTLQFRARAHAEQASVRGKHYNDRTLSITWVSGANMKPLQQVLPATSKSDKQVTKPIATQPMQNGAINDDKEDSGSKIDDTELKVSEDALLRFDEEEEEEAEEDRSWRR